MKSNYEMDNNNKIGENSTVNSTDCIGYYKLKKTTQQLRLQLLVFKQCLQINTEHEARYRVGLNRQLGTQVAGYFEALLYRQQSTVQQLEDQRPEGTNLRREC